MSMNTIIDNYKMEKEGRERRLLAYADAMQKSTLESSAQIIRELVEERHRQNMTQQETGNHYVYYRIKFGKI